MLYLLSSIVLVILLLLVQRSEVKINICRSIPMAVVAYECYLCLVAGLMSVITIPVDTYSISFVNVMLIILLLIWLLKKKTIQHYYVRVLDVFFLISLIVLVVYFFYKRFSPELNIVFSTSDPAVHLKSAGNFINDKFVYGMYIGQLLNGLFIESLLGVYSGAFIYKSFIILYAINFYVAGAVFWAMLQKYTKTMSARVLAYAMTFIYLLGYPYNDLLFGFVYLQMGITVICYLIALMQDYLSEQGKVWIYSICIGMACLGTGISYTLLAPPVFVAVLIALGYKAYQEKWFLMQGKIWLSRKFILHGMAVFLIPTLLTLWSVTVADKTEISFYGSALMIEGYIYRNLYSDFLLWILPAVYGVVRVIQKKKWNLLSILFVIFGFYYFALMRGMFTERVSTYYFYKLNYLVWMLVLAAFMQGIVELVQRDKLVVGCYLGGVALLGMIFLTDFEATCQEKNFNILPYTTTVSFFQVYNYNHSLENAYMQKPDGFIEI